MKSTFCIADPENTRDKTIFFHIKRRSKNYQFFHFIPSIIR